MNEILEMIELRIKMLSFSKNAQEILFLQDLYDKVNAEINEQWHGGIDRMGEDS